MELLIFQIFTSMIKMFKYQKKLNSYSQNPKIQSFSAGAVSFVLQSQISFSQKTQMLDVILLMLTPAHWWS